MSLPPIEVTNNALFARVQVAELHDGHLPIPASIQRVVLEIGASDRDTLDRWLDENRGWNDTFLVTSEPLLDKYSRGIARRKQGSGDAFQPLGHHHSSAIILPFAIGPSESGARTATFNVR
jgi:hypothetical protein